MKNNFLKIFVLLVVLLIGCLSFELNVYAQSGCDSSVNVSGSGFTVDSGETFDVSWSASFSTYEPTGGRNFYTVTLSRGSTTLKTWTADTDAGEQVPESGSYRVNGGITEETDFVVTATVVSSISCPGGTSDDTTITFEISPPPSSCSISSFTADDTTPPYNSATTLRFSLSGSFPWSISLLQGGTSPSPTTGTNSGDTADTGNLTATQVYRLTCGSATRDLTVTPLSQGGSSTGTITIQTKDSNGNNLSADWGMDATSDTDDFNGTGGGTFTKPVQQYRIIGSPISGYTGPTYSPSADWVTLSSGGTITFTLVYTLSSSSCIPNGSCSAPTPACESTTTGTDNCGTICSRTGGTCSVTPLCGSRNTTYPVGTISYPSGSAYCEPGIPTSTPSFPPPGGSVNWYCVSGGSSSGQCTASVEIQKFNVTVNAVIRAGGSIKSQDGGINCGATCSSEYAEGSNVTLKAIPSSSYWQFSSWSGDCSGTSPECTLTGIVAEKNVTANFTLRQFRYIEF